MHARALQSRLLPPHGRMLHDFPCCACVLLSGGQNLVLLSKTTRRKTSFPRGVQKLLCDDFLFQDFDKRSRRKGGWMSLSYIKQGLGMEHAKARVCESARGSAWLVNESPIWNCRGGCSYLIYCDETLLDKRTNGRHTMLACRMCSVWKECASMCKACKEICKFLYKNDKLENQFSS
jgi:hypothetical protein